MLRVYNISNIFPSSFAQQGKLEAVCFQQSQATLHHRLFLFVTPSVTTFKVVFHLSYKPELPRLMPVSFASCVVCSDRAVGSVWQHICTVLSFIFTRQPPSHLDSKDHSMYHEAPRPGQTAPTKPSSKHVLPSPQGSPELLCLRWGHAVELKKPPS